MIAVFFFIWIAALVISINEIGWRMDGWSHYSRGRKIMFFVHLFFLIFSVGLSLTVVIKTAF